MKKIHSYQRSSVVTNQLICLYVICNLLANIEENVV